MNKYVAQYQQGDAIWINANSLLEAAQKAQDSVQEHRAIPMPPKRFIEYKKSDWSDEISVQESPEYIEKKQKKSRIEYYNNTRRINPIRIHQFMS